METISSFFTIEQYESLGKSMSIDDPEIGQQAKVISRIINDENIVEKHSKDFLLVYIFDMLDNWDSSWGWDTCDIDIIKQDIDAYKHNMDL
jgi:hypothetical protein